MVCIRLRVVRSLKMRFRVLIFLVSMKKLLEKLKYFTLVEKILWCSSVTLITLSFILFDRVDYLTFIASLLGVTSLIFIAKGNPFGQVLMIIFAAVYGVISYSFRYYGEMLTYVCMSLPMAVVALITWLKNPYKNQKSQVTISKVTKKTVVFILLLFVVVTVAFYFILKHFGTANIVPSTVSVTTSFIAVCFSAKRSPYFALAYAVNDVVLIVLWVLACMVSISYLTVVICFAVFLANDLYSFINWIKMRKKQQANE